MAEAGMTGHESASSASDPFANFSFEPPRSVGPLRSLTRRSRYRAAMAGLASSRDQLGSNTSLSSLSGSTQNLLDPVKLMSMQEDAKSRRISAEVMKHCLYASVISSSPYRRRQSMHPGDYYRRRPPSMHGEVTPEPMVPMTSRWAQSLPVSPAQSIGATPTHSPTGHRQFRTFLSNTNTPCNMTPDGVDSGSTMTLSVEEDSWKGLASLFKPRPRYIPAAAPASMSESVDESMELSFDGPPITLDAPPKGHLYHSAASP